MHESTGTGMYYTKDHDWIDFWNAVAFTGVSNFKLTGFKEIHDIIFTVSTGYANQGDLIAILKYKDYRIDFRMPVDGRLVHLNEELITGNKNHILKNAETGCWIAMVMPSATCEKKHLIPAKQYLFSLANMYAR